MSNEYEVNPNIDPKELAGLVQYVFDSWCDVDESDDGRANLHDAVMTIYGYIFPDASVRFGSVEHLHRLLISTYRMFDLASSFIRVGETEKGLKHIETGMQAIKDFCEVAGMSTTGKQF